MSQLELLVLIESFEAVVQHGGVRRAAEARHVSKATISRHLASLEQGLGVKLLVRSTRELSPTREGRLLLERFGPLRDEWRRILAELAAERDEPAGTVRVTAPHILATRLLPPILAKLADAHPSIVVDLHSSDRLVNVLQDTDVAIRSGPLAPSELRAVKLFDSTEIVVGHPELLARFEGTAEELGQLPWVVHTVKPLGPGRALTGPEGTITTVEPTRRVEARTSDGFAALLREGLGLGLIPDALIRTELGRGELVATGWVGRPVPFYAVYSKRDLAPRRINVVIEHLRTGLDRLEGDGAPPLSP